MSRARFCVAGTVLLVLIVFCIYAGSALAAGQTWLSWAWEPAGAGIHSTWYSTFQQAEAEVQDQANIACANGWISTGSWVFGHDYCAYGCCTAATPTLQPQGVGSHAWAQSKLYSDYLWAWAQYYV